MLRKYKKEYKTMNLEESQNFERKQEDYAPTTGTYIQVVPVVQNHARGFAVRNVFSELVESRLTLLGRVFEGCIDSTPTCHVEFFEFGSKLCRER